MDRKNYHKILSEYVPEYSLEYVIDLLERYPLHLKITRERQTKHGDFRMQNNRQPQITINYNLNSYAFLITLLHELAHFINYKNHKRRVAPHGTEWKNEFKNLMSPLLRPEVFPDELLKVLSKHMIDPKASSNSDPKLVLALKKYDTPTDKILLHTLTPGTQFILNQMHLTLGEKRRTRYLCEEVKSKKKYLVNQNAEVMILNF